MLKRFWAELTCTVHFRNGHPWRLNHEKFLHWPSVKIEPIKNIPIHVTVNHILHMCSCYVIKFKSLFWWLCLFPGAGTTHNIMWLGHQTLFLLNLKGMACDVVSFVAVLIGMIGQLDYGATFKQSTFSKSKTILCWFCWYCVCTAEVNIQALGVVVTDKLTTVVTPPVHSQRVWNSLHS